MNAGKIDSERYPTKQRVRGGAAAEPVLWPVLFVLGTQCLSFLLSSRPSHPPSETAGQARDLGQGKAGNQEHILLQTQKMTLFQLIPSIGHTNLTKVRNCCFILPDEFRRCPVSLDLCA